MKVHRLSLLFITLFLFVMASKRKSSTVKSAPRVKISRPDDEPTVHIRNITLHSQPNGRLSQNVTHIPQTTLFSELPELLSIEDDDDDEINMDDDTGSENQVSGLLDDVPSNDPEDDVPSKKLSKESVSSLTFSGFFPIHIMT